MTSEGSDLVFISCYYDNSSCGSWIALWKFFG
ncbi:unnamed protein product [Schistosoma margrebowiei]|uniref:Uncharacterized protein n=1 Tax=Schistosoma margrebowiei TaxID=48269 RepID=A0A183M8H5_9TREM|nr:unnamed protein product [Schistosoma margrebowiei]